VVPETEQILTEAASPALEPSTDQHDDVSALVAEPSAPEAASDVEAEAAAVPEAVVDAPGETAEPPVAAEPEFIEVWRPGRPPEERRGPRRHRRPRSEHPGQAVVAAETTATAGDGAAAEAGTMPAGEVPPEGVGEGERPHRRHRRRHAHSDDSPRTGEGRRPPPRERREQGDRGDRPQKFRRSERFDRRRDRDDNRPPRIWGSERPGRSQEPDPNSPFAKLAALKAQLEADKEQR
jgi:ATP-dependent RNA helicase SUPV3L1/SUV3